MKGHSKGRQCQYGVMLFLAFGAAIFGVMLLHKLRERRIFNLLVKDKDRELISLHLLLQKERENKKEAKMKNEEMKAKIYSLRTQKMELDNRILEMHSTISSLKDEQKAIESALEEKQNEIKLLREKEMDTNKENPQVMALTETLKQMEAEIEDLKHRLEYPTRVWSVSTDDPSKPAVNLTATPSINEITNRDGDHSSTRGGVIREDGAGFTDTRETTGDHSKKLEIPRNDQGKKTEDSQDEEGLGIEREKKNAISNEAIVNNDDVVKTKDEYGDEVADDKERGIAAIGDMENPKSHGGEGQQLWMDSRGGKKLETKDNSQSDAGYRVRGKHGYANNPKGKRWTILARNRRQGNIMNAEIDDASIQSRRFHEDAQQSKRYKRLRDGELRRLDRHRGNHQQDESSEMKNDKQVRLDGGEEGKDSLKPLNSLDAESRSQKGGNIDINQQVEKRKERDTPHENFEKPNQTPDDIQMNRTVRANENASDANNLESDEKRQSEERSGGVQRQTETREGEKVDENSEELKVADKYDEPEDLEVAETREAETYLRESRAMLEEEKDETGEETDEPEF